MSYSMTSHSQVTQALVHITTSRHIQPCSISVRELACVYMHIILYICMYGHEGGYIKEKERDDVGSCARVYIELR